MSLQLAAQHLASKGRGPDTMLVHMAPGEVKSLQALARAHGGTLTTNPDTGLPEAGFLSSILPLVAGAALTATGVGAPMAAMLVGGAMTAATGSLRQGLMAGLGAYGGAGLMGSVTGAGNAALQAANTMPAVEGVAGAAGAGAPSLAVTPAAASAAPGTMASVVTPADANLLNTSFGVDPSALNVAPVTSTPVYPGTSGVLGSGTSGIGAVDTVGATPNSMASIMGSPTPGPSVMNSANAPGSLPAVVDKSTYGVGDTFKAGLSELGKDPSKFMTMDNLKYGMAAAAPAMMQEPKQAEYDGGGPNPYSYEYDPGRTYAAPSSTSTEVEHFRPRYKRLAEGGTASGMSGQSADAFSYLLGEQGGRQSADAMNYLMGQSPRSAGLSAALTAVSPPRGTAEGKEDIEYAYSYDPSTQRFTQLKEGKKPSVLGDVSGWSGGMGYAAGGVSHLGDYSDGGRLLRGPGDGVSDSIPATIANKRPARLADGEFVVPARVVSELGNGSTDAGARKLYAMMDRVQKARGKTVGKNKVAVNSRADKYLPA